MKEANIHMLSIDAKDSPIKIWDDHLYVSGNSDNRIKGYHLYLTTDEEIKEKDWAYRINDNTIFEVGTTCTDTFIERRTSIGAEGVNRKDCRKIVATTNPELWEVKHMDCDGQGCSKCNVPFADKIPQFFIQQYVDSQGSIKKVMIEDEKSHEICVGSKCYCLGVKDKSKCGNYRKTDEKLKLNSSGEVIISPVEKIIYTKAQLKQITWEVWDMQCTYFKEEDKRKHFDEWFDKNYPKYIK